MTTVSTSTDETFSPRLRSESLTPVHVGQVLIAVEFAEVAGAKPLLVRLHLHSPD